MRAAAALALLAVLGCSSGPRAEYRAADLPRDPDLAAWHVHLDARDRLLGAYTIILRFNPKVAVIRSIEPCAVRHFKGSPEYDPDSLTSGVTRVTSLDAFPSKKPDNEYHLLTVTFGRVGGGTLEATAEIERLYDADNKQIPGRIESPTYNYTFP